MNIAITAANTAAHAAVKANTAARAAGSTTSQAIATNNKGQALDTRTLLAIAVVAFVVMASNGKQPSPGPSPAPVSVADVAEDASIARLTGLADMHDWLADRLEAGEIVDADDLRKQKEAETEKVLDKAEEKLDASAVANHPVSGDIDNPAAVAKWHREVAKGMRRAAE